MKGKREFRAYERQDLNMWGDIADFGLLLGHLAVNQVPELMSHVSKIVSVPDVSKPSNEPEDVKKSEHTKIPEGPFVLPEAEAERLTKKPKYPSSLDSDRPLSVLERIEGKVGDISKDPVTATVFAGMLDGITKPSDEGKKTARVWDIMQQSRDNPLKIPKDTVKMFKKKQEEFLEKSTKADEELKSGKDIKSFSEALKGATLMRYSDSPVIEAMREMDSYVAAAAAMTGKAISVGKMCVGESIFNLSRTLGKSVSGVLNDEQKEFLKNQLSTISTAMTLGGLTKDAAERLQYAYGFAMKAYQGQITDTKEFNKGLKFLGEIVQEEILKDVSKSQKSPTSKLSISGEVSKKYEASRAKYKKALRERAAPGFVGERLGKGDTAMDGALRMQLSSYEYERVGDTIDRVYSGVGAVKKVAGELAEESARSVAREGKTVLEDSFLGSMFHQVSGAYNAVVRQGEELLK